MAEDDKDDREDELEGGRMPLLDHLIELRNRLLWSFGAIIIAWAVCSYFSAAIYRFLAHPLAVIYAGEPGRKMIFTALTEAFFTYLKVSFWAAICLSFPIIASQLWKFVAPGLYKQERRAFLPYVCDAGAVRDGRLARLFRRDPDGVPLLPELREPGHRRF